MYAEKGTDFPYQLLSLDMSKLTGVRFQRETVEPFVDYFTVFVFDAQNEWIVYRSKDSRLAVLVYQWLNLSWNTENLSVEKYVNLTTNILNYKS
jgi:hypothetical protein